jgi:hypothetical protein
LTGTLSCHEANKIRKRNNCTSRYFVPTHQKL